MKFRQYITELEEHIENVLEEKIGFNNLPKGWTADSVKKFAKSLTGKAGDQKGFFDACVSKMSGNIDDPEGFCASVKDEVYGHPMWRGKDKPKKVVKKQGKAWKKDHEVDED